jgi:hypothetical protein
MYEYDTQGWAAYKKLSINADPKIVRLQSEIADKQKQIDAIKADIKTKKN